MEERDMNVCVLVGNLATDPELRQTSGGKAVCTFRLAVSRPGGSDADFFTVVAWERQAEICKEYLAIGRRVAVEGRLHHSTWQVDVAPSADGEATPQRSNRRSKVELIAHRVELLGGAPPRREQTEGEPEFAPSIEAAAGAPDLGSSNDAEDRDPDLALT
jgi:single-strand DNA-binding protein